MRTRAPKPDAFRTIPCGRGARGTRSREAPQHTCAVLLPAAFGELCQDDNSREPRSPRSLQARPVCQAGRRTRMGCGRRGRRAP